MFLQRIYICLFFILFVSGNGRAQNMSWDNFYLNSPDRIYINLATQHYGIGEEYFGIDGPNEFNPGVGVAWTNIGYRYVLSAGAYKDSYNDLALTAGLSRLIYKKQDVFLTFGISATMSLGGQSAIYQYSSSDEDNKRKEFIDPRLYAWPYFNLTYGDFFVQWRPALNKDWDPAGVFSFGLTFKTSDLFDSR